MYKNLNFLDKSFVRQRLRNAHYGEEILSMGKCFVWVWFRQTRICFSMRGRYKIQIAEGWKWQRIFLSSGRDLQEQTKVLLYSSTTTSEAQTPTYVEVLPSPLSVDEHKQIPARMRYSNNFCTLRRELQTDAAPVFKKNLDASKPSEQSALLWFADCQNSTTLKLAPPGTRASLGLE